MVVIKSPFATLPFWGRNYGGGSGVLFVHFLMFWGWFRFIIIICLAFQFKRLMFSWISLIVIWKQRPEGKDFLASL